MNLETNFTRNEPESSSPMSSPISSTRYAQRFGQYKPRTSASSLSSSFRSKDVRNMNTFNLQVSETPQKQLWREKLRQQVEKRVKRDRQRAYERGRSEEASSGASSDANCDMDDESADSLDDELYRRVMIEERRRLAHASRLSYEHEFGDSDDILMGDVEGLEQQFTGSASQQTASGPAEDDLDEMTTFEEDPERIYHAYMAALGVQGAEEEEEDEFEREFEDIDPQVLERMLASS